jgi:elongation factor 1-beta
VIVRGLELNTVVNPVNGVVLIKMAQIIITIKIMPESPEVKMDDLKVEVEKKVKAFAGEGDLKFEENPIGFGLSSLNVLFVMDEEGGSTEKLEDDLRSLEEISSAEVVDMRRALG